MATTPNKKECSVRLSRLTPQFWRGSVLEVERIKARDQEMYAPPPHLNLVVLRSSDIDRAASFYRMMGLLFIRHAHGSGPEHYSSTVNGLVFELYPMTAKSTPTTGTRIGFRVDSVDGVVELLSKIGAEVVTPPADSEWGRRAVVKDLDGHIVELVTPNPIKPGHQTGK
jgi:predicted enzyme related to lactoylglutathione lyase